MKFFYHNNTLCNKHVYDVSINGENLEIKEGRKQIKTIETGATNQHD